MDVTRIRHRWPEGSDFVLERPQGVPEYVLLHFLTPIALTFSGQTHHAEPGSFVVFSPGFAHTLTAEGPLLHDWMHITGDVAGLMARYQLSPDTLYTPHMPETISDLTAFLEMEFFAARPFWPELCQAKLNELFIRIAHSVMDTQPQLKIRDETVERLRELRTRILENPQRSWSIADLADSAHLSQSRLHALYKTVFGISPMHDLILMRVEKAKQMLVRGESVTSAAEQLGYSNVFHFIRQFKQVAGSTPKQYQLMSLRSTSSM